MWIANSSSDDVSKFRVNDGVTLGTFSVGRTPVAVAFDGINLWVANTGSDSLSKR